jgi:hypothetical protein
MQATVTTVKPVETVAIGDFRAREKSQNTGNAKRFPFASLKRFAHNRPLRGTRCRALSVDKPKRRCSRAPAEYGGHPHGFLLNKFKIKSETKPKIPAVLIDIELFPLRVAGG